MTTADLARRIAGDAQLRLPEKDRFDLGGRTYMAHFQRVADRVEGDWTKAVAQLHDTVEDTDITLGELGQHDLGEVVIEGVRLMTHTSDMTYEEYVDRIWANRHTQGGALAYRVKIADLCDNLDVRRGIKRTVNQNLAGLPSKTERLREKHQPALDRLLNGRWLTGAL